MLIRTSAWLLVLGFGAVLHGQGMESTSLDSDKDGVTDQVEASLLDQFRPAFLVSRQDCSVLPASFVTDSAVPIVRNDDGTIYGQVFPRQERTGEIEIHYYHLWRKDCGELGHRLDAEHVSVLLTGGNGRTGEGWKAAYWYAASHEDTLCDASQITRASTLDAVDRGATVWISSGKHASFLNKRICRYGCGGDRCQSMEALLPTKTVNLGELTAPMNNVVWLGSAEWPLAAKMSRSDFPEKRLARLERLPASDIAWANPEKRPAQAALLGANAGVRGAATGTRAANTALAVTNDTTGTALHTTSVHTGHALAKAYHAVGHALSLKKLPAEPKDDANAPGEP